MFCLKLKIPGKKVEFFKFKSYIINFFVIWPFSFVVENSKNMYYFNKSVKTVYFMLTSVKTKINLSNFVFFWQHFEMNH